MAFTTVPTVATNDPWTAAQHNQYIRDNFAAVRPDIGSMTRSTNQSIADATQAAINFTTEDRDTANFIDLVANDTRLTMPYTGWFYILGRVNFASNATGRREVHITKNGGSDIEVNNQDATNGVDTVVVAGGPNSLAASDYVECEVYQNSTGALNAVFSKFSVFTILNES